MMRAAVAPGLAEPLEVRNVPIPTPGPGEVLVRIEASGVCHTDVNILDGDWPMKKPQFPLIPGHEGAGRVATCGPNTTTLKPGDRVGVFWLNSSCNACDLCITGREAICARQVGTGYAVGGTYADYCVVSERYAVPLPDGPSERYAPLMCAGLTSYKALKELRALGANAGDWVVVSGVGGTGHLAIQYAIAMGYNVAAVDIDDDKVAVAESLGAKIAINAARHFPTNRVLRATGGAHGAIVTANQSKAFEQAMRMLRRGGTCVLVGIAPSDLAVSPFDMVIKGLTLRGTLIGTRHDLAEALRFVAEGKVLPKIENRTLEDVNDAVDLMRRHEVNGRIVLRMT